MASPIGTWKGKSARTGTRKPSIARGLGQSFEQAKTKGRSTRARVHMSNQAGHSDLERQFEDATADPQEIEEMTAKIDFYKTEAEKEREKPAGRQVSQQEIENLTQTVMRHMLCRQHEKPDVPVRRDELVKLVMASYRDGGKKGNLSSLIIAEAQYKLASLYGLELRLQKVSTTGRAAASETQWYVLRSLLPAAYRQAYVLPADDTSAAGRAFVITVLALVHAAGEKMSEGDLWDQLEELGVEQRSTAHPALGKPSDLLKDMLTKRYLLQEKGLMANGSMALFYKLGPNALDEFTSAGIQALIESETAPEPRPLPENGDDDILDLS